MLLSSTGLSYAKHFCGEFEMLSQVTLGEQHPSCGMAMEDSSCGDEHAEDHNCCNNEYTQVDTDDHFSGSSFDIQIQPEFILAYVVAFNREAIVIATEEHSNYSEYDPPPLIRDIPVLFETFLI